MNKFDLYRDIATRTGGDIYVGVVGPVRTGKSTLIKQIMQQLVVDKIENADEKMRAVDEIPQSADGKTIMTTEPKFVPNEAVNVALSDNLSANLRLIDCVGFVVDGALGSDEDGRERQVETPWSPEKMDFSKAAEIGTSKVIKEHSTIALVVTTDGSFSDIARESFEVAESRVVAELKQTGKPFAIMLNVSDAGSDKSKALAVEISEKYDAPVIVKNALKLTEDDIAELMQSVLLEFEVKQIDFDLPRWVQGLDRKSDIVAELREVAVNIADNVAKMRDYQSIDQQFQGAEFWDESISIKLDAGTGSIVVKIQPKDGVFYKVLSEECGLEIDDDFALVSTLISLAQTRKKTERLLTAIDQVDSLGYGVVSPDIDDIVVSKPEIVKQGGQYGVKFSANAPSLHIMKLDVESEISPVIGSEEQSKELISSLMTDDEVNRQAVMDTNIFGRTLGSLVYDGIKGKINAVPADAEVKMKKTMARIVNEGKGGVICILL